MELEAYFTLWGWQGSAEEAVYFAKQHGFDGIEGQIPIDEIDQTKFANALRETGLRYIQEIVTTGTYVPDRSLSLEDHIYHFEQEIEAAKRTRIKVQFITCLGGCDAWSLDESLTFFRRAQDIADKHKHEVSFETHRGRSLFNPWRTEEICKAIPNIKLTFDISHWCVVCEGLQQTELELIKRLATHAHHIHARVGYDQGPQVPQPFEGLYTDDLHMHLSLWQEIWRTQASRGLAVSTVTPEFGIDGYQYRSVDGLEDLVNPIQINIEMLSTLKENFLFFRKSTTPRIKLATAK